MAVRVAGAFRRLAAAAYDALLVVAVLFVVTGLLLLATHGEAITHARVGAWAYLFQALVALVIAAYFGVAWTARGQTLGMKAWSIRVETASGALPSWRRALLRLACAAPFYLCLAGGLLLYMARLGSALALLVGALPLAASLAALAFGDGGALHDRWSGTRVVRLDPSAGA